MKTDLKKAAELLRGGDYTCVLYRGDTIYKSHERGVKPLLQWLDNGTDLKGFSAADKVVGKAAAFLYVLLGVCEVYAPVMSKAAAEVLKKNGVRPQYDTLADRIQNRTGTGLCPMEQAVFDEQDPKEALKIIKAKVAFMQQRGKTPTQNDDPK